MQVNDLGFVATILFVLVPTVFLLILYIQTGKTKPNTFIYLNQKIICFIYYYHFQGLTTRNLKVRFDSILLDIISSF